MIATLNVITPPASQVVTIDILRRHLRLDNQFDDILIQMYLDTATQMAEQYLNRAVLPQTLQFTMSHTQDVHSHNLLLPGYIGNCGFWYGENFPHIFKLPMSPVTALTTVTRGFWGADDVVLTEGIDYIADLASEPARVKLHNYYGNFQTNDHLQFTYQAGYPSVVPASIVHAILLIVTAIYEHRGDEEGAIFPSQAENLLSTYRQIEFGNWRG